MRKTEAYWVESRQRWQIKVQSEGDRKTFTSTTPGKKGKVEAEKKADRWLESKHNKDLRLDRLWPLFLEATKINGGTANYNQIELMGRVHILPVNGHKKISRISVGDWQRCIDNAFGRGLSKRSCINIRAAITALHSYCRKNRYPMERPDDLNIPKDAPVKEKNILQPDDIRKLFSVDSYPRYGKDHKCFFIHAWRMYVATGLRRGELAGLQKGDVKDGVLYIRRAINAQNEITGGKNNNARRYIVLSARQQKILDDQAGMLKSEGIVTKWLFPDRDGAQVDPKHIYNEWTTYRKHHGIKSNIHEMRHTLISIAQADVPEQLLKQMVGHSKSMDTFGVYGHEVDGEARRASDLLSSVFDRILE